MSCFQKFRVTLEEVYSATVQTEDELTYASATLILAGLLQVHARTPRYASHRARLESFPGHRNSIKASNLNCSTNSNHPRTTSPCPSPRELASAGFFHTGSSDETVCPSCGLGLRDWQPSDQPEACHLAYSTAEVKLKLAGDGPAMPCLYMAAHRWLTSELPLARKSLVPAGRTPSVCTLPGIITRPSTDQSPGDFASLADRLRAIVRIMTSSPSPQGWPVENARALGHSNDLIVLALWRLQGESTELGLACPATSKLRLDPQGTIELLRALLRLQEDLDPASTEMPTFDLTSSDIDDVLSDPSDAELSAEDAETAALSRCRHTRNQQTMSATNSQCGTSTGSLETVCNTVHIPHLYEYILWWAQRWP